MIYVKSINYTNLLRSFNTEKQILKISTFKIPGIINSQIIKGCTYVIIVITRRTLVVFINVLLFAQ